MPAIRCRQIVETDIPAIATLLARGFPARTRQFWLNGLNELARRQPPRDLPQYGYLIENSGEPVGALLLICSLIQSGTAVVTRCNLSSWYVEPAFRAYASLLVAKALRHKDVTYVNVSPAPHTWPIIEAQGFARYCDGVFVAVPMVKDIFGLPEVRIFDASRKPAVDFDAADQEILAEHARHGCISVWCATPEHAYPFVFRPRLVKHALPCVQLIYCRGVADFVRFAGPIGRYLARRGRFFVILDANGSIPDLLGVFRSGSMPKYFRGPQRPRLGDLAYTEYAIMGV